MLTEASAEQVESERNEANQVQLWRKKVTEFAQNFGGKEGWLGLDDEEGTERIKALIVKLIKDCNLPIARPEVIGTTFASRFWNKYLGSIRLENGHGSVPDWINTLQIATEILRYDYRFSSTEARDGVVDGSHEGRVKRLNVLLRFAKTVKQLVSSKWEHQSTYKKDGGMADWYKQRMDEMDKEIKSAERIIYVNQRGAKYDKRPDTTETIYSLFDSLYKKIFGNKGSISDLYGNKWFQDNTLRVFGIKVDVFSVFMKVWKKMTNRYLRETFYKKKKDIPLDVIRNIQKTFADFLNKYSNKADVLRANEDREAWNNKEIEEAFAGKMDILDTFLDEFYDGINDLPYDRNGKYQEVERRRAWGSHYDENGDHHTVWY